MQLFEPLFDHAIPDGVDRISKATERHGLRKIPHNTGGTDATDEPNYKKVKINDAETNSPLIIHSMHPGIKDSPEVDDTEFVRSVQNKRNKRTLTDSEEDEIESEEDGSNDEEEGMNNYPEEEASVEVDIGQAGDSMHPGINGV